MKVHGCSQAWPALDDQRPPLRRLRREGLAAVHIRISGGAEQVTYAGHPLYTFSADTRGATDYVGVDAFGGDWDALSASGHAVK